MNKGIFILILLILVITGMAAGESFATLFMFEGDIVIYNNNEIRKTKKGMPLDQNNIIDTTNGSALVFYRTGEYYGYFKGNSARAGNARDYRILNDELVARLKKEKIEDVFIKGTPLPGFHQENRKKNINLILVLDVSTSMRSFFEEIKIFIDETILQTALVNKDYLYFYTFGTFFRERVNQTVDMPGDRNLLSALVGSIAADEDATDIGLALEALDKRLAGTFPYNRSIIFFITDGKNDPHDHSPYAGVDIYTEGAFKAFETVKKGKYKVMLLSIGKETAAKDLSGPLGGEYIEVASNLTAESLNNIINSFVGDMELITPTSLGKIGSKKVKLKLGFLSSYDTDKEVEIKKLFYSIDGGPKQEVTGIPATLPVRAGQQVITDVDFLLPQKITKGSHSVQLELVTGNISVAGSLQEINYKPCQRS